MNVLEKLLGKSSNVSAEINTAAKANAKHKATPAQPAQKKGKEENGDCNNK